MMGKTDEWNITGFGNWGGKFHIPDSDYDTFMTLVHDHRFIKNQSCSLLERQKTLSPILIDLDFRYASGGPLTRRFTNTHIRDFVTVFSAALHRFMTIPDDQLQFFVSLKPCPEADTAHDAHKDGIHIVCPAISLTRDIQCAVRGYLLQNGVIDRIFGDTGITNQAQDIYDLSVIRATNPNNWFLYGACKPDKQWYKLEHVFDSDLNEIDTKQWSSEKLIRLLSLRVGHDDKTKTNMIVNEEHSQEWQQLLSMYGDGKGWAMKPAATATAGLTDSVQEFERVISGECSGGGADEMIQMSGMSVRSGYSTEDIALAYKLVRECLNPEKRCGNYTDWVNMAICLKNISNTDESMGVWIDITRRTGPTHKKSTMSDADLKTKWNLIPADSAIKSGRKPLLMGTLHLWAKEDSSVDYRAILALSNRDMAMLNESGSHVSVAELVVRMYRHEFRCSPPKKGATAASMDWYQFEGHTWRSLKTSMRVRERLSNEVRNQYIQADREVGHRIIQTTSEDERTRLEAKRKNILKIENMLHNSGFKDSVMKETAEKFHDEDFPQSMNQDTTTVGFSNGVIELRHIGTDGEPHVLFRPGRPDDCISFQMGRGIAGLEAIPYIPYDPASPAPEHLEILEFFRKIYPDFLLREYCLTLYSACLEGTNREQKFYIKTGSGGNGKSKIIDLQSKTMGEYQESLPVTTLTRRRADGGSANPELIVIKNKRYISMVEPEEGEKINTSIMKQLSGEDVLKARGLFQDQDNFIVTGRIFMSCNDLPKISSTDGGTWRRLRVIPHVAEFLDQDKPINPSKNIHHKDPLLDSKIVRWRPFYAGILIWYFENRYLRGGLKEPDIVLSASRKYKEENDVFAAFCSESIVKELGAEVKVALVLSRFTDWIKFNPGKKVLTKDEIKSKMAETYGTPVNGKVYVGIRLSNDDEDASGNLII
jgi:P4 family phage/plasmid primase-like protien